MKSLLKRFKYKTATPPDLRAYLGKTVVIEGKPIVIEHLVGNMVTPKFLEVNGEHLIGMLRFFAQMTGAKDITEDQFLAFEEMDLHIEKMEEPKVGKQARGKDS